eukprot:TRINITY_DN30786_c0_g1_i1.p1 TRINITY_DN30786_c0_g1~~TRINITY_DN30786_c0_g1_i1.p1  ORF type:complete len:424 (+),score=79.13 TRINITY_DN30786_c0_g1_i1:196-1467(+)
MDQVIRDSHRQSMHRSDARRSKAIIWRRSESQELMGRTLMQSGVHMLRRKVTQRDLLIDRENRNLVKRVDAVKSIFDPNGRDLQEYINHRRTVHLHQEFDDYAGRRCPPPPKEPKGGKPKIPSSLSEPNLQHLHSLLCPWELPCKPSQASQVASFSGLSKVDTTGAKKQSCPEENQEILRSEAYVPTSNSSRDVPPSCVDASAGSNDCETNAAKCASGADFSVEASLGKSVASNRGAEDSSRETLRTMEARGSNEQVDVSKQPASHNMESRAVPGQPDSQSAEPFGDMGKLSVADAKKSEPADVDVIATSGDAKPADVQKADAWKGLGHSERMTHEASAADGEGKSTALRSGAAQEKGNSTPLAPDSKQLDARIADAERQHSKDNEVNSSGGHNHENPFGDFPLGNASPKPPEFGNRTRRRRD